MSDAMKGFLLGVVLACLPSAAAAEELKAFRLTIGGQTIEINPGETAELELPGGTTEVTLDRNEFATHTGELFSFNYPSNLTVARSEIAKDITQHLVASALGTLVIVQEYRSIDPSSLDELMLNELTKESVQAGATMTREAATRMLADGRKLSGLRATVTAKSDVSDYEVLAFGTPDEGVLAVTRIDRENIAAEQSILDTFWQSFALKF